MLWNLVQKLIKTVSIIQVVAIFFVAIPLLTIVVVLAVKFFGDVEAPEKQLPVRAAVEAPKYTAFNAMDEVEAVVKHKYKTGKNLGEISEGLRGFCEKDPKFVVVCLTLVEARHWPHVSDDEAAGIFKIAMTDSAKAIDELKVLLDRKVKKAMIAGGYNPEKEIRNNWDDNNPSTALLFIEYPLSKKLGKETQMIKRALEGGRDRPEWFEPELNHDQYCDWYGGKRW